jgi:hypothetical protein
LPSASPLGKDNAMARHWSPEIAEIGDQIVALSASQAALLSTYLEAMPPFSRNGCPRPTPRSSRPNWKQPVPR